MLLKRLRVIGVSSKHLKRSEHLECTWSAFLDKLFGLKLTKSALNILSSFINKGKIVL